MPKKNSQKNSHRIKIVPGFSARKPVESLPVLFNLPEDLSAVRQLAFVYAMENAFQAKKQKLIVTNEGLEAGAIEEALIWEKKEVNGKVGTNDPVLFRKTYAQFFMRIYPAMVALFETKPFAFNVLDRLSYEKRMNHLQMFSGQHLEQVERIPLDEPIVIEWED